MLTTFPPFRPLLLLATLQPFANPLAGTDVEEDAPQLGGGGGAANPLFSEQQPAGRSGFKPAGRKGP